MAVVATIYIDSPSRPLIDDDVLLRTAIGRLLQSPNGRLGWGYAHNLHPVNQTMFGLDRLSSISFSGKKMLKHFMNRFWFRHYRAIRDELWPVC